VCVCRAKVNAEQYRGVASEHAQVSKQRRLIKKVARKLNDHNKKRESLQAHRHEANRQAERCRVLEKKNADLEEQLSKTTARYHPKRHP
jgi:septal ring factor EnvC (AmiA/AmiB activator)